MKKNVLMKLDRITRTYQMGEVAVHALKETSWTSWRELLVILGPSGSGKVPCSTLSRDGLAFQRRIILWQGEFSHCRRAAINPVQAGRSGICISVLQFDSRFDSENVELAAGLVENPLSVTQVLEKWALRTGWTTFLPS